MSRPSPEDMVRRAHVAIMRHDHWCWLSQVILLGQWRVSNEPFPMPARTDGYNIVYPEWRLNELWDWAGDAGIRYIVLHENLHKAFRHLKVWKALTQLNNQKANYAMDVVNNNIIAEGGAFASVPHKESGCPTPSVFHPEWTGLDTGEVWDKMTDEGNEGQRGAGDDDHMEGPMGFGEGDGEGSEEGEGQDRPTDDEIEAMISSAVAQGLFLQRQKCPEAARHFQNLTTPKVDWRKALASWMSARQWGHDLANWRRRSRRGNALNLHLPQRYTERTGKLVLAVDTSGSISNSVLQEFLSEVVGLAKTLKPAQIELLYWGSGIAGHETYLPQQYDQLPRLTKPKDGGGTVIEAVVDWTRSDKGKGVTGVVVLTDGEIGRNWFKERWPCPVFVVLNTNQPCPLAHARI